MTSKCMCFKRKMKVVFGTKKFSTQKQAGLYVKSLLESIGVCSSVKGFDINLYNDLCEILKRHPQQHKKLSNMVDIKIVPNILNRQALEIHIVKEDGTFEDISWRICISGKEKTTKHELASALRYSINEQTYDFKKNTETNFCSLCKRASDVYHVDHVIQFDELMQNFIEITLFPTPTSYDNASDGSNRRAFKEKDHDFETEWKKYHATHATYRMLCETCNLRRPKFKRS